MENTKQLIEFEKQLCEYDGEDKVVPSTELRKSLEQSRQKVVGLQSSIPSLDRLIHSFDGGELTVLSGITGNGKTLFAQTLTKNFSDQKKNSLWFSYEVMPLNFLRSFGTSLPNFYMPQILKENNLIWLEKRVHEAKIKYSIEAVFVDHLHFLISMTSRNNMSLEIGNLMRGMKKIALKHNICFFLIAHTKKTNPDYELDLGDTRDSSFIEQEADNVFYLWRKPKTENEATLKIAKNRRMGVFGKKVHLIKSENFLGDRTQ